MRSKMERYKISDHNLTTSQPNMVRITNVFQSLFPINKESSGKLC